ncbi:NLRC3, partial [Symbiodinium sp. CCMP2592]
MASEVRLERERVSAETFGNIVQSLRGNRITEEELQGILEEVPPDSEGLLSCRKLALCLERRDARARGFGPGLLGRAFGRCLPRKAGRSQRAEVRPSTSEREMVGSNADKAFQTEEAVPSAPAPDVAPAQDDAAALSDIHVVPPSRTSWAQSCATDSASADEERRRFGGPEDAPEDNPTTSGLRDSAEAHDEGVTIDGGKLMEICESGSCAHPDPGSPKSEEEYDLADKSKLAAFLEDDIYLVRPSTSEREMVGSNADKAFQTEEAVPSAPAPDVAPAQDDAAALSDIHVVPPSRTSWAQSCATDSASADEERRRFGGPEDAPEARQAATEDNSTTSGLRDSAEVPNERATSDGEKPMEICESDSCARPDPRSRKWEEEYDLADKSQLAAFLEDADIYLGGPGTRRISKKALHIIVRNLKGDRFTVGMLQVILQEVGPDREGLLNCEELARCLRSDPPPKPQEDTLQEVVPDRDAQEPQKSKRYDLAQKQGLADFLIHADIRLVRAHFILKLHREGQRLPRRQEAESAYVEGHTALVTHEEVQAWADGVAPEGTKIVSLSHCWESKEHCDPLGYQLAKITTALTGKEWLFIDYTCLFQFQRLLQKENDSFRRAMQHMHVLYCHDATSTLRIESLTPKADIEDAEKKGDCVMIYHHSSGLVEKVPVTELVMNRTPYTQRGWCIAEREWSSTRAATNLSREVDASEGEKGGIAPMVPDAFRKSVAHQLKFTHKNDKETVCRLQEEVYKEKAETCRNLRLADLGAEALEIGLSSLELYPILERLEITQCELTPKLPLLFKAVEEKKLPQLQLQHNNLSEEAACQLAEALQTNATLSVLSLDHEHIGVGGVKALAQVLQDNSSLTDLTLNNVGSGNEGVSHLAEALQHNTALQRLSLVNEIMTEGGAESLWEAMQANSTLIKLDLSADLKAAFAMARAVRSRPGQAKCEVVHPAWELFLDLK